MRLSTILLVLAMMVNSTLPAEALSLGKIGRKSLAVAKHIALAPVYLVSGAAAGIGAAWFSLLWALDEADKGY